ncbi:HD domain-containing protein [Flavobacterium orientale]|uniref:HD/PDEase domain-containing protein n=1 Tax=Flavobacterium orientale TaxID=1756020 RepID=A0A916XZE2_9FLAO|nr:HD domain-containing protein [Flavobacterium orientale]GGD23535.1 hypothetical protein GCM10011343_12190 [Flavobacterium orientale]
MTNKKNFPSAKAYILNRQKEALSSHLYYHSLRHVLDVYAAAKRIANKEGLSRNDTILVKTAALYHDCGYMISTIDHETASCEIAKNSLPQFGYSSSDISIICNMILATKIPHQPQTLMEEILCDADLDYLGRGDFYVIGDLLFKELLDSKSINDRKEWNKIQLDFLKAHTYFTATSLSERQPQKAEYIKELTLKNQTYEN